MGQIGEHKKDEMCKKFISCNIIHSDEYNSKMNTNES